MSASGGSSNYLDHFRRETRGDLAKIKKSLRHHVSGQADRSALWPDLVVLSQRLINGDHNADVNFKSLASVYGSEVQASRLATKWTGQCARYLPAALATDESVTSMTRRVVSNFVLHQPHVDFLSHLPLCVTYFLSHARLDEADIYAILVTITFSIKPRYVAKSCAEELIQVHLIGQLHKMYNKKYSSVPLELDVFKFWIFNLFSMPTGHVQRMVDCYLCEGVKVLYRTYLALLRLYCKSASSCTGTTVEPFATFCQTLTIPFSQLMAKGVRMRRLSVAKIDNLIKELSHLPSLDGGEGGDTHMNVVNDLPLTCQGISQLITDDQLAEISTHMPARVVVSGVQPWLAFGMRDHGVSLSTFYRLVGPCEPSLLLIKTVESDVIGAYCSTSWDSRQDGRYFGNGECFVFTFVAGKLVANGWDGNSVEMFMCGESDHITIGGGGDGPAIYINANLSQGRSEASATFKNAPLCTSGSADFAVLDLEVIAFGHADD